jgi:Fic family protein
MDELLAAIARKKERLDKLRPLAAEALANLAHYYDIELTYTSNAIEGNTLSAVETTLVIEQGVTIGGKPLKDHLEALDHYDAIRYVHEVARQATRLTEGDVRNLHSLTMRRSRPDIAGRYAGLSRYVRTETGRHVFPSPVEIPALMGDLAAWLGTAPDAPGTAFAAHWRLVEIHPFNDGNGRTARLLMNLILIRAGCSNPRGRWDGQAQRPALWAVRRNPGRVLERPTRLQIAEPIVAGFPRRAKYSATCIPLRNSARRPE